MDPLPVPSAAAPSAADEAAAADLAVADLFGGLAGESSDSDADAGAAGPGAGPKEAIEGPARVGEGSAGDHDELHRGAERAEADGPGAAPSGAQRVTVADIFGEEFDEEFDEERQGLGL